VSPESRAVPRLGAKAALALYVGALAIRAAAVLASGPEIARFADAPAYLLAARALVETGRYPLRTDPYLFRPPGFPAFLAAATLGHPDALLLDRLANAALGSLVPLLLAALSARLFRRRGLALATGALAAVHPSFVLAASRIQSEPLFLVLLLVAAHLLLAATDRPSSNLALLSGAALALAALTRSVALALTPFLLAPLADARWPRRARVHLVSSAALGFVLALAPWTARNALVFHELILVNDGAGFVFYGRNADAALPLIDARDRAGVSRAVAALEHTREERIAALPAEVRGSPGRLSRALTKTALDERRANPAGTARLLAWKTWDWLRPYPDPRFWPMRLVVGAGLYYVALFVLAGIGLARVRRRGAARFALAFLVVTMAVQVALETNWRYRAALWDPVVLLYAVPAAVGLVRPGGGASPGPPGRER
jgi:4-amino-4-deoxy-L-arabinose transferase-like glycosyltransferase